MKRHVLPALAMTLATLATTMPVYAADVNPTSGSVPVTLEVTANYTVSLPASVALSYTTSGTVLETPAFEADYNIVTAGTLPSGQKLEITCDNVTLSGEENVTVNNGFGASAGNFGSATVDVTDPSVDGTSTGHLETDASGIAQGTYTGTAAFTYKLVSAS